jgi:LAO/AO transport system kinase
VAAAIELAQAIHNGNRRALAKAISLVESTLPDHQDQSIALLACLQPPQRATRRIGITGAPGVGKSTIIENIGKHIVAQNNAVAVLAIDPSSGRSGGSILGDKTRMAELSLLEHTYIRPSPAGITLGGTTARTREIIALLEHAGYTTIIVETVGVGQSETAVASMVDCSILLTLPTAGDELQGIKRGIMEIADIIAVTKQDLHPTESKQAVAMIRSVCQLLQRHTSDWHTKAVACSAMRHDGCNELLELVDVFFAEQRRTAIIERRSDQRKQWFNEELQRSFIAQWQQSTPSAFPHGSIDGLLRSTSEIPTVLAWNIVHKH